MVSGERVRHQPCSVWRFCGASGAARGAPSNSRCRSHCEPHKTCFIQSYVDIDPGAGAKDYACGGATYDEHNGIDFRLLSAAARQGAAWPCSRRRTARSKATRDGVADVFFA